MAPRDASKVQLDFPQLTADLIRQLNLTGTVGLLDFLDAVRPVYIVAQREGALAVTVTPPVFSSAVIVTTAANNPAANAIIGDTGSLPDGDYDLFANITASGLAALNGTIVLEHRNAANNATLAELLQVTMDGATKFAHSILNPLAYSIGLNERLRFRNNAGVITGMVGTSLGRLIRPTP